MATGKPKQVETNFWKLLKAVGAGPNTMGDITQQGSKLQSEVDQWTNPQGDVLVRATPLGGGGGGFQLQVVSSGSGPEYETVYWLPWKNFQATSVKRKTSEKKSNFFMTTALTGCKLTVTNDMVVHTAFAASDDHEQARTGPRDPNAKRVQGSPALHPGDFVYNMHRTLVFGMKTHTGAWSYKVWQSYPAPGSWVVLL